MHYGLYSRLVALGAARPEQAAVPDRLTPITWAELADAAQRWATAFAAAGCAGRVVLVDAEPSPASAAAVLGALGVGAAVAQVPTAFDAAQRAAAGALTEAALVVTDRVRAPRSAQLAIPQWVVDAPEADEPPRFDPLDGTCNWPKDLRPPVPWVAPDPARVVAVRLALAGGVVTATPLDTAAWLASAEGFAEVGAAVQAGTPWRLKAGGGAAAG